MNKDDNIKIGEIVFFKLSNKAMVVEKIEDDNITCTWLKPDSIKQEKEIFKLTSLRKPNDTEMHYLKLAKILP